MNPKYKKLMGKKSYPSAKEIPEPVDLSIIIRPAEEVPDLIRELKGRTSAVIIESAGFAEIGRADIQDEIRKLERNITSLS